MIQKAHDRNQRKDAERAVCVGVLGETVRRIYLQHAAAGSRLSRRPEEEVKIGARRVQDERGGNPSANIRQNQETVREVRKPSGCVHL